MLIKKYRSSESTTNTCNSLPVKEEKKEEESESEGTLQQTASSFDSNSSTYDSEHMFEKIFGLDDINNKTTKVTSDAVVSDNSEM